MIFIDIGCNKLKKKGKRDVWDGLIAGSKSKPA